jgi:phospholipase C
MMTPDQLKKNVDTIIVLMMENRSFDHVLGYLRHPSGGNRGDVVGIDDLMKDDYVNKNTDGEGIRPFWRTDAPSSSDLPHSAAAVREQLNYAATIQSYLMNGFVRAYEDEFHSIVRDPPVLGLLQAKDLPSTSPLASTYTVCDNWFACVPTSTAPNRLMSMCGATPIADTGTLLPDQPTIYDWLSAHGIRWRVYAAGLPFFALMPKIAPLLLTSHFRRFSQLGDDVRNESAEDWPQVIFIEPDYYDCPVHFRAPCDNHAPLAMAPGEAFVAEAYRALTAHAGKWSRSVFVFTYDEHGGFFDHVPPLDIKYRHPNGVVAFDSTGPRIPVIVGGPYAPARGVSHAKLDNTSILQLIAERFGAPGEIYSSEVQGRKQQGIESAATVLDVSAANTAVCSMGGVSSAAPPSTINNSELRKGFAGAIQSIVHAHQSEATAKYPELRDYVNQATTG